MLRKTLLIVSTSALLGAAVIAPNAALAQLPPLPAALLPVSQAVARLVCLVPAVLRALGPLAFLVLLASEAVVLASMAVRVTFMAAPGAMPTTTLEFTAAPKTMAMAAQAMPTAMDRGETATGRLMASLSTAILTPAAAITPTTTATGWAHTGAFRFAPKSECGGHVTASRYARGVRDAT